MWLAVMCVAGTLASPEGVQFFEGSWEKALQEAGKEKKLVYVDFYTDW